MQTNRFGDLPSDAMQRVKAGHGFLKDHARKAAACAAEHAFRRTDQAVSVEDDAPGGITTAWRKELKQRQGGERLA